MPDVGQVGSAASVTIGQPVKQIGAPSNSDKASVRAAVKEFVNRTQVKMGPKGENTGRKLDVTA